MKRLKAILAACVCGLVVAAGVAIAGSVYERTTVTAATSLGTATYTNNMNYQAATVKRVGWMQGSIAVQTVTVSRITSDYATQTVCVVTSANNIGSVNLTEYWGLKNTDKLYFLSSPVTGGVAVIEYEVQLH